MLRLRLFFRQVGLPIQGGWEGIKRWDSALDEQGLAVSYQGIAF